jgi:peptidoglycan/LPS O-acetylase OafA/YrhL
VASKMKMLVAPPRTGANSLPVTFRFRHFPELDGLRGLAIVLVVAGHVLEFGLGVHTDFGGLGVLLFFVLSGFLITGLLDRERLQTGRISLSAFYIRRGLRLFPALFVFLATLCLMIRTRYITDTPWYAVAACLLYVRNIWGRGSSSAHIWSLSLEEQFYACWPWIMNVFDRSIAMRVAALGAAFISVFRMVGIHSEWFEYGSGIYYQRSWFRFDSILVGCVLALLLCAKTDISHFRARFSCFLVPLALWPTTLAWSVWGEAFTHVWYLTVQMTLAALILLHLMVSERSAYRLAFCHPLVGWFGRISYSWYLWQQLFTAVYSRSGGLQSYPLKVAISLLLAVISHKYIERPFLQLKDRLGRSQKTDRQSELEQAMRLVIEAAPAVSRASASGRILH